MNENGDWDYDAWHQFAKEFTSEQDGVPIYGYEMGSGRSVSVYVMLAWAWGTEQWNDDFSASIMDNEENVALWKWIQQFYLEGLTPLPGSSTTEQPISYTNGRSMATMAGQWYTRTIVQDGAPDLFDIGMVPFPTGPSGQYSVAALNSFYFSSSPGNVDPAWAWYKERSFSEAAASIYAKIGGGRFPSIQARRAGHRLRMGGYRGLRGDPPDSAHLSHEPQRVRVDQHLLERGLGRDGSGNTPHRGDPRAARRRVDRPRELVTAIPGGRSFSRRLAADYQPLTAHHLPRAANCRLPTTGH